MRLGLCILAWALAVAFIAQQARADPQLLRWQQPDYVEGDTWEVSWDCETAPEWQPLEPQWLVEDVRAAVSAPVLSCTAVARATREGVSGYVSNPIVYVPEPSVALGLLCGVGGLSLFRTRLSRDSSCDLSDAARRDR